MISKDLRRKIKFSCVAIGIAETGNPLPLVIGGTGFIIDREGFIITATHVIDGLEKRRTALNQTGKKHSICAFKIEVSGNTPVIRTRGLSERRRVSITPVQKFLSPKDYDVIICRMVGNYDYPDFLEIKEPGKIEVLEEIAICGYPGGSSTFNFADLDTGVRLSPQIQLGLVSGIMPMDDVTMPTGIQTDIIGTGGSSGSPIVEATSGKVIGVAQRVLSSPVLDPVTEDLIGISQSGLIFGISNYALYSVTEKALKQMKEELDENGKLKPEYLDKYQKNDSDLIQMNVHDPKSYQDVDNPSSDKK